jgi:hypothetical protein
MPYIGTQATIGSQTQLSIGATPTPIYEIVDISFSGQKKDVLEGTNLNSAAKEFILGLGDSGEVQVTFNQVDADPGQALLIATYASGASTAFVATKSNGNKYTFNGLVSGYEPLPNVNANKITQSKATIKITGLLTLIGIDGATTTGTSGVTA